MTLGRSDVGFQPDAWIAVVARQRRLPVLSRDERFGVVPDLDRRGW